MTILFQTKSHIALYFFDIVVKSSPTITHRDPTPTLPCKGRGVPPGDEVYQKKVVAMMGVTESAAVSLSRR